MEDELSIADLAEMLGITYMYKEMGHKVVQNNIDYEIEILERLLTHEKNLLLTIVPPSTSNIAAVH